MEYIVKIKSKFKACLNFQNKTIKSVNENEIVSLKINLDENEKFSLFVEPVENNNNILLPYNIYFKNINNKLNIDCGNVEIYNYKNIYFIDLLKFEVFNDMKILLSNNNYSIYNTYVTNFSTSLGTSKLPKSFDKVNVEKINSNNVFIFSKNDDRKYMLVLYNNDIVFSDYFDSFKKGKKLEILTNINDIAKHIKLTLIDGKKVESKFVYNKSPKLVKGNKIIPLAFLQALKLENVKLCKYYLSENLRKISTLDNLKNFFGNFKKIEIYENDYIAFYEKNNESCKTFNFEIINGKINKINTN